MTSIISFLYAMMPFIVASGYLPQIYRLIRSKTNALDISIIAWMIWGYTSLISLLYSTIVLPDLKFAIVNATNFSCVLIILGITIYKRHKYKTVTLPNDMVVITEKTDENPV